MATIIVHAGRPKTGSTSIQRWIVDNRERLRREQGVHVLAAKQRTPGEPADGVSLEPYESGEVHSNWVLWTWLQAGRPPEIPRRFFDDLATLASELPAVLITAEGFSDAFVFDELFARGFEELVREHEVRIVCYVRPQHNVIEASWRQGGHRRGELEPSAWVQSQTRRLRYLRILDTFAQVAPDVGFTLRPFVPDLLDGRSPVEDFTRRFLGLDERHPDVHANPGLPLELVNVLREAPEGWFWTPTTKNLGIETYPRERFAAVLEGLEIPESAKIRRSRLILQQHCHEVFEAENQEVIRRLRWPIENLVPPATLDGEWNVTELDELWAPGASEAERELIFRALRVALASHPRDGEPPGATRFGSPPGRLERARTLIAREGVAQGSARILRGALRWLRHATRRP